MGSWPSLSRREIQNRTKPSWAGLSVCARSFSPQTLIALLSQELGRAGG